MKSRIQGVWGNIKQMFQNMIDASRGGLQTQILDNDLNYESGLEFPLQNPDKLLDDKGKDLALYDTMMRDDRVKSVVDIKTRMALSANGEFMPASEDPKHIEQKEWISDTLYGMETKWWDVLYNLLEGGIVHGNKVGEKIFDMVDGKITLTNIKFMHSIFFDFGYAKSGKLDELIIGRYYGTGLPPVKGDLIKNKFIIFVYPYLKNGNYYGDSDLRECYPLYYAKYQIFRFRNIYLQNYGQPIPVITADSKNVTDDEKGEMTDHLENLQDNTYFYIPGIRLKNKKTGEENERLSGKFEIALLENKHTRGTDQYEKTIDQLDKQISRKLLVPDKMGFTSDSSGARAQAQTELDILKIVVKDLHGRLEDTVNEIIKQLTDLNYPGVDEYTTWQFEKIDEKIENEMLKTLLDKGVVDKREAWIRTWTGIPELSEEEQNEIDEKKEEDRKQTLADAQQIQPAFGAPGVSLPKGNPKANNGSSKQKFKTTVDYKKIEEQYDIAEADFVRDFMLIHKSLSESLIKQVERKKIIENKDLVAMKTLRVSKTDLKKLMSLYYAKLYIEGKASAIDEIQGRISKVDIAVQTFLDGVDWLDRTWIDSYLAEYGALGKLNPDDIKYLQDLRTRAFYVTGDIEQRMLKDVHYAITNGLDSGMATRTIISRIENVLADDRKKYAITIARTNASSAFNTGRMNFFQSDMIRPLIEAYQYSAIIDNVTTLYCETHDGQVIYPNDPTFGMMNPPNHFNCRSLLIPIMVGEGQIPESQYYEYETKLDKWGQGVAPKYRLPAEDFGGIAKSEGGW